MFTNQIRGTYLNKSKLTIKDEYGMPLPYEAELKDYCEVNGNLVEGVPSTLYDYKVEGFFRHRTDAKSEFIIASPGDCIMYITGVPKEAPTTQPYKMGSMAQRLFSSFWEDATRGYLFQILNKKP